MSSWAVCGERCVRFSPGIPGTGACRTCGTLENGIWSKGVTAGGFNCLECLRVGISAVQCCHSYGAESF